MLGTVTAIGNTEIQVDLGTKHAGYIPYDEVSADPTVKAEDILKVGDEIEVFVVRVNDQEGTVQLSKKKLDGMKVWDDVEAAAENKDTVEGVITEENKGGLVANVKGVRVFIPASQTGIPKGRRHVRAEGPDRQDEDHRVQPRPPQSRRLHPHGQCRGP